MRKYLLFTLLILTLVLIISIQSLAHPSYKPIPKNNPQESFLVSTLETTPETVPTQTIQALPSQPANPTPTTVTNWQDLPIVPTLSPKALKIYNYGLSLGNNPKRFTKIGDGEISANWFLVTYDKVPAKYNLGPHKNLSETIEYFAGSFEHKSQTAKRGYNTTKILDSKEANKSVCLKNESPLDCEIRIYKPSFALISMGTNQAWDAIVFEKELRIILDTLIKNGIVPILSTKADNVEGDHRINKIIAKLAIEYQLPLWNFWKACQTLPNNGLQKDLEHLTYFSKNDFGDQKAMTFAWPNRNLTALLTLESIFKQITQ
jgi:hypothetical protein